MGGRERRTGQTPAWRVRPVVALRRSVDQTRLRWERGSSSRERGEARGEQREGGREMEPFLAPPLPPCSLPGIADASGLRLRLPASELGLECDSRAPFGKASVALLLEFLTRSRQRESGCRPEIMRGRGGDHLAGRRANASPPNRQDAAPTGRTGVCVWCVCVRVCVLPCLSVCRCCVALRCVLRSGLRRRPPAPLLSSSPIPHGLSRVATPMSAHPHVPPPQIFWSARPSGAPLASLWRAAGAGRTHRAMDGHTRLGPNKLCFTPALSASLPASPAPESNLCFWLAAAVGNNTPPGQYLVLGAGP